jgi:hypothetical protein
LAGHRSEKVAFCKLCLLNSDLQGICSDFSVGFSISGVFQHNQPNVDNGETVFLPWIAGHFVEILRSPGGVSHNKHLEYLAMALHCVASLNLTWSA